MTFPQVINVTENSPKSYQLISSHKIFNFVLFCFGYSTYIFLRATFLVNQLIIIPIIYYPSFFFISGIIQNLSVKEMIDRGSKKIKKLLRRNWLFWIPVQFVQFRFVPEPYQIPFLCIVGLLWTFILSTSTENVQQTQPVKATIL